MLVWGSRFRWTLASALLYLGFAGWAIGGTGAVLDSLIPLNFRFHNTLWVAAHFHTYLLLCVMFWALALMTMMFEEAAGRPAGRTISLTALGALLVGGYGFVGMWYASGALGVPRRFAVHPEGTEGYSLAASIFVAIFAVGFLLLLAEYAVLAREARLRGAWARAEEAPVEAGLAPAAAPAPLLSTGFQFAAATALVVVLVGAFTPMVGNAVEDSVRYHHLAHAAQFLLGVLLGILFASLPTVFGRVRGRSDAGIAAVVVAPAMMLLAMVPSIYENLEENAALHSLYHLGVAALGVVTGVAASSLGLVTGRIVVALAVAMGLMYAAGVTGG
jgi:heme/copper-type cytochrome/quinol oxidase subunit 1